METQERTKLSTGSTGDVSAAIATISAWEQDPASGNSPGGGQLIQQPAPNLSTTFLPTVITHPTPAPPAQIYLPGTAGFRYWTAVSALYRGSVFWSGLLPGVSWHVGPRLPIDLDHGVDFNAYYDRVGLKFFHGTAGGRVIYSGESPDVICHEQGHAILDSLKPQLWNAASTEVGAFHESFGDQSAILCALQLPSLRAGVLAETAGTVYRSSRLSRLAEQLGWAIRQTHPTSVDPDCLRNAVNSFFYRAPSTLPTSAPASSLSSEVHSFSRIFTAAFLEGISNMFRLRPLRNEANLLQVSHDIAQILIAAIRAAAVVPSFFSQVAANMIHFANIQFPSIAYGDALRAAFIRRGILSPAISSSFAAASAAMMAPASVTTTQSQPADLPKSKISVAEYGLGVDTITVHAASEPKHFKVAGAALALGSVEPPSEDEAAKSFIEDLLRRGKLKGIPAHKKAADSLPATFTVDDETHERFTHELKADGNEYVLTRIRVDCSFCH